MSNRELVVEIDGYKVTLTNLDKVLWPDDGLTKKDLIRYYAEMADLILPHLRNRPLTVVRYPNGIQAEGFFQKNAPPYTPEFVNTVKITHKDSTINYIVATNRATLVWLANQAAIELHPWLSTHATPEFPNVIVFDLDPAEESSFDDAREIALIIRDGLKELGLQGYPKLSGASGIHIYVPILPKYSFQITSRFVEFFGALLEKIYPQKITQERLVKKRTGRVYIDHLQNLYGKTIVAPYSVRPRPGAPVSCPVTWEELESVEPDEFNITNMVERVASLGDLFAPVLHNRQSLDDILPEMGVQ